MRAELLSAITQSVSTLTQFAVSQELPWSQNGTPLFRKNMKKIYVDTPVKEQTTAIAVFSNGTDVYDNTFTTQVYVATDAKNPPSQLNALIDRILVAKDRTTLTSFSSESD
jgi:hypothetical protein